MELTGKNFLIIAATCFVLMGIYAYICHPVIFLNVGSYAVVFTAGLFTWTLFKLEADLGGSTCSFRIHVGGMLSFY